MPRGLADLSVSKNMFDRYYCLKSFSENFGKTHRNVRFCIPTVTWAVKPTKIVSEYDQVIPQSQTADKPVAS